MYTALLEDMGELSCAVYTSDKTKCVKKSKMSRTLSNPLPVLKTDQWWRSAIFCYTQVHP